RHPGARSFESRHLVIDHTRRDFRPAIDGTKLVQEAEDHVAAHARGEPARPERLRYLPQTDDARERPNRVAEDVIEERICGCFVVVLHDNAGPATTLADLANPEDIRPRCRAFRGEHRAARRTAISCRIAVR